MKSNISKAGVLSAACRASLILLLALVIPSVQAAGLVTQLIFTTQPGAAINGQVLGIQPVIQSADATGVPTTNGLPAHLNVTLAVTAGGGTLTGTTVMDIGLAAGNGMAAYTNLVISGGGSGTVLTVTAAGGQLISASATLLHRWSFSDPQTNFTDSVNGVIANLVGGSSGLTNAGVTLLGNNYIDLAGNGTTGSTHLINNLASGTVTLEAWLTYGDTNAGQRIFDFGMSDAGEGNQGNITSGISLTATDSQNGGHPATYVTTNGSVVSFLEDTSYLVDTNQHYWVLVYDPNTPNWQLWLDGALRNTNINNGPLPPLNSLNDLNAWLGLSQNTNDSALVGVYDEFRIWDGVLSAADIAGHNTNGANQQLTGSASVSFNVLTSPSVWLTGSTSLTVNAGQTATFTAASAGSTPLGYQWYFNTNTVVAGATGLTLTLTNVQAGNAGTYLVVATNAAGSASSPNATLTVNLPPAAPTNLVAVSGNGQIGLTWTAVSGATSYNVKQSLTNGGPYTVVTNLTAPAYTSTGLVNGTTYYYVVSAINGAGESSNSLQASASLLTVYTNLASGKWSASGSWSATPGVPAAGGGANTAITYKPTATDKSTNDLAGVFWLNQLLVVPNQTMTIYASGGNSLGFTNTGSGDMPLLTNGGANTLTLNSPITLTTNLTIGITNSGTITINSNLSGAFGLISSGNGTLNLAAPNSYGSTLINAGSTVKAANASSLGTGAVTNNGTLNLTAGANYSSLAGIIAGSGTINVSLDAGISATNWSNFAGVLNLGTNGSGRFQAKNGVGLSAPMPAGMTINVFNGSQLWIGSGTNYASITLWGSYTGNAFGQIRLDGGSTLAGSITLAGTSTTNTVGRNTGGAGTLSGPIGEVNGSQPFIVGASLIMTGTNTYSGNTTLNGGLTIGGAGLLSSTNTPGQYAGKIILNTNTFTYNSSAAETLAGAISGTGALTMSGSGTLTLTGTNTYSGATTINAGTVMIGGSGQLGSGNYSGNLINNGAFNYASSANQTLGGAISGTGSLTVSGSGTLTLTGTNTYGGVTTVSAGTLALGATGSINSTPKITLAAGSVFDVSARAAGYAFTGSGPQQTLAGGSVSGTATIAVAASQTVTLNSSALLSFQASGGVGSTVGRISLTGAAANLTLNNNAVTVNVTGAALAAGSYRLLDCPGTLSGSANTTPTLIGPALPAGYAASVSTTAGSGGHVDLIITATPAFSGLANQSIYDGTTNLTLTGIVSSTTGVTPVYPALGDAVSVTIRGLTAFGTVTNTTGAFAITYGDPSLAINGLAGSPYVITYAYAGNGAQFLTAAPNDASTQLTVNRAPPTITSQPASQAVPQSGSATFSVGASGTAPLTYQWQFNGSPLTNATNTTLTVTNVQVGNLGGYAVVITNLAGSVTSATATLSANPLPATNGLMGYWPFDDTNAWVGSAGQLPLIVSNLTGVPSWSGNAVKLDSINPAILAYSVVEPFGSTNLGFAQGTVRFWFKPDWSSADSGGTGPQTAGRLLEAGTAGTNGWWTILLDAAGNTVSFVTQTNGVGMTNLAASVAWSSNVWHQVALTYSAGNSQLYVDGQPVVTNGLAVQYWPNAADCAAGFRVGSDVTGTLQAGGVIDELQTFAVPLAASTIQSDYAAAAALDSNGNGIANLLENQLGLDPYYSPNGLTLSNGLQVFTPLK